MNSYWEKKYNDDTQRRREENSTDDDETTLRANLVNIPHELAELWTIRFQRQPAAARAASV